MNANPIVSLSNDELLCFLQNLPLKSLLYCQQTCRELDQRIRLLFDHDREEIGKIFKLGNPAFSIICSVKDLKIQLAANKFFKKLCFKEFMHNWNLKFVKDIFPFAAHGKLFFGLSPDFIPTYKRVNQQNVSQEMTECFMREHLIFEKEIFILCEEHGFSSCLADSLVNEYLDKKNPQLFSFACKLSAGFRELLGLNEPKVISLLETMYDKLFKGYVLKFVTRIKEDITPQQERSNRFHEVFMHILMITESKNWSTIPEINALSALDGILANIQNGHYLGVTLTKPHLTLRDRMRGEFLDSVTAMLNDFAKNL